MIGYDIAAWILLVVTVIAGTVLALSLAALPGRIAHRRNHPWVDGVTVAGWITFFLGFAIWPFVLVWAYVDAPRAGAKDEAP